MHALYSRIIAGDSELRNCQIPVLIRRCNSRATCAVISTHITIILESLQKPGDDTLGDLKFLGYFQLGIAVLCNGSSDTFDKSAHCSKRIRMSDDSSEVCDVCNKNNADFPCTGVCTKFFHMECLGITKVPENFKCPKCSSGLYSCFACQKSNGVMKECSNSKCSKYYHAECLVQYECANKDKNICPLHTCVTCYRENPRNIMSHKG
ncbi:Histone-lysine N-methyltransferase NSD2 [Araneus ventricosus]|uniref:Histone-lysine N-methyltransferase NSD2 n=1 Tax=Araneus ventricosus TaxID=182803 RepID=A0A4Y2GZZ9_ARAVE|nr:Histone-lysine N-methyltransferase NSD2 [Araneus ventricosus]